MRKTLQELTIKDNFMFGAVMLDPENCKGLLELILEIPIESVKVEKEKNIVYHPEYKGVRLDVFAKDEQNTHYNVEMQVERTSTEKRSRYYHSQMDMDMLQAGTDYEELPDSYVIFICDYDPLGAEKYRYTMRTVCVESPERVYNDGVYTVFLSTYGRNADEVPEKLVRFLDYVHAGLEESERDFEDEFVSRIQQSVQHVKSNREMGERYMVFEEMLRKERQAGIEEGRREGLQQGQEQKAQEIFEQLINHGMDIQTAQRLTKLDTESVKALLKED